MTAKAEKVNNWLNKYKDLLSLLTRSCGINDLERGIDKLLEIEKSVGLFYEQQVQVHVTGEDLIKLSGTK